MSKIAGTVFLLVDGQQLSTGGTFNYGPGEVERETMVGAGGVAGFKEMPIAGFLEAEIFTTRDLSLKTLSDATEAGTITVELANGFTYVLNGGWVTGRPEANAIGGTVTIRWEGPSIEEIAPATP